VNAEIFQPAIAQFRTTLPPSITRAMVDERTRALARLAGRIPPYVAQEDYERAKRELTGESDRDRQAAILDATAA
jgi:hypothetical protein